MTEETPLQRVKFYQTGTRTVGNRLMSEDDRTVQASMGRSNAITSGHRACQGCGEALGARAETLAGLCGLGDLVLTCSSTSSRNFSLGKAIGEGQAAADLMANRQTVAEGAHTAPVLQRLARAEGIDMPIVDAVVAMLEGAKAADVADALLARPLTTESRSA